MHDRGQRRGREVPAVDADPAPYRDHDKPPEAKYADLEEFLKEFKLRMPPWAKVKPRDFRAMLEKIRERPDAALLESVILRSQSLAVYAPDNIGHFGLALEAYAHFTSPIRRYPDLLVHRAIKYALAGGKPDQFTYSPHAMAALSLQSSERSRRADEAQREVDERYRAAWMETHVGKEFDGTISGVTSFGLFVELDESKVNGLVHVTQLANDFYHFDAVRKTLTGERTRPRISPRRPRAGGRAQGQRGRPQDRLPPGRRRCRRAEAVAGTWQAGEAGQTALLARGWHAQRSRSP